MRDRSPFAVRIAQGTFWTLYPCKTDESIDSGYYVGQEKTVTLLSSVIMPSDAMGTTLPPADAHIRDTPHPHGAAG